MLRGKHRAAALAVPAALVASAVAIAAHSGPPRTDRVAADITFTHIRGELRTCEGQGGEYIEQKVVVTGTATSETGLAGDVSVRAHVLVEADTGDGYNSGRMIIRDTATGALKLSARYDNAHMGPLAMSQGVLTGFGRDAQGRAPLVANWRITVHPNGAVTAQIGGEAADGRLPALLVAGRCSGRFERFEGDFPAPGADGTQTAHGF